MAEVEKVPQLLSEALKSLDTEVVSPSSSNYDQLLSRFSDSAIKRAAAITLPPTPSAISAIVSTCRDNGIPFVVAGGRHASGGASSSENGVVIDLRRMRSVTVDKANMTITAEGGCLWVDVDEEGAKHGVRAVGGTVNHTGIGGLILGGGFGWLTGKYGLTIDQLLSVDLVLADGSQVTASESSNPDLFWAVRGCGASFGVATSFTFRAFPMPDTGTVWAGVIVFELDCMEALVAFANKHHERGCAGGNAAIFLGVACPPPAGMPKLLAAVYYDGGEAEALGYFKDLIALDAVLKKIGEMPYEKVNALVNDIVGYGGRRVTSGTAMTMPLKLGDMTGVVEKIAGFKSNNSQMEGCEVLLEFVSYEETAAVPLEATAFANRGRYYGVAVMTRWNDPEFDDKGRQFNRDLKAFINERMFSNDDDGGHSEIGHGVRAYANYEEGASVLPSPQKMFGPNLPRLLEVKRNYDPKNLFHSWHNLLRE